MAKARKVALVGLDGIIPEFAEKFIAGVHDLLDKKVSEINRGDFIDIGKSDHDTNGHVIPRFSHESDLTREISTRFGNVRKDIIQPGTNTLWCILF